MRKSILTITFALSSLFSLVFFISHFRLSELDITDNTVPQPHPIESSNNKTNSVIIVTAASYEKLADFEGVDGFYQKMWDNRMSFAEAHGNEKLSCHANSGYTFMLFDSNGFEGSRERHPRWCKPTIIAEAMEKNPLAEWIWWLDMDAIIMTPQLDLYEYVLDPTVLKDRLLQGETILSNNRIRGVGKPLPDLVTGEVCHVFLVVNVDTGPLQDRHNRRTRLERSQRRINLHSRYTGTATV